jgi:hypothetical protein
MLAVLAHPFTPVILKFVPEPLFAAAEHHHGALRESADVGLQVAEHVFSD